MKTLILPLSMFLFTFSLAHSVETEKVSSTGTRGGGSLAAIAFAKSASLLLDQMKANAPVVLRNFAVDLNRLEAALVAVKIIPERGPVYINGIPFDASNDPETMEIRFNEFAWEAM